MLPDASDIALHMPFMEDAATRASVIIEIGLGNGNGSTRAFARGLERSPATDKLHIGVDILPENPCEPPLHYWTKVLGASESPDTANAVAEILGERKASIIFIDTIHTYEHMKKELPIWARFADDRTLWIFHDTWIWGPPNEMMEAIKQFAEAHGWEYSDHSREAHGLGLMRWRG